MFAVLVEGVRLGRLEYAGSVLVVIGLLIFVLVVRPGTAPNVVKPFGWAIASAAILAVCVVLIAIGRTLEPGAAAALIGTAGGLINGLAGGLTAVTINQIGNDGLGAAFASWLIYATLIALLLGVLFPIWAFQSGPVTASMPPVIVFNPAIAYVLGIVLLDETVHETTLDLAFAAFAWALMIFGIIVLSRSKVLAAEMAEGEIGGPEI